MKLNCNSGRYADFKTVANTFSSDVSHVFYSLWDASPHTLKCALVLCTSGKQYISSGITDGECTESTFLTDFPSAVKADVDGAY
jgi:hypothetical protein